MRLKTNINLIEFLKAARACKQEVRLETLEGDRLNLKSVLSQYVFAVMAEQGEDLSHCTVVYSEEDRGRLEKYIE